MAKLLPELLRVGISLGAQLGLPRQLSFGLHEVLRERVDFRGQERKLGGKVSFVHGLCCSAPGAIPLLRLYSFERAGILACG